MGMGEDEKMNVQAFIDNISFPVTLKELEQFADWFNVEEILNVDETEWTAPRWTVKGDIAFFFHAKTAIQKITMLETKLKQEKTEYSEEDYLWLGESLQRARKLYKLYGGKIFAVGRVSGRTEYEAQEGDEFFHWASRFYAPIDSIYVLPQPIDISEFSSFLPVSTRGAITPVVGSDFDRLKKIIASKNEIPKYLKKSRAIPLPLQKINPENWLDVTQEYRRLFALEIQFRRFYVDYFLRALGEQKTFYAECECYRRGKRTGFAENAIKIGGKWCFVEVKLNVSAEPHLHNQLKKYCHAETVRLQKGERTLPQEKVWQNTMLVIDTEDFYIYDVSSDQLTLLESLDNIKTEGDIKTLQSRIVPLLS